MKKIFKRSLVIGTCAVAAMSMTSAARATEYFQTVLSSLNGIGTGAASLALNGDMLTVNVAASGLDDGPHLAHLHGLFTASGNPMDSHLPTIANDTDGDGYVELAEALPAYGPIILNMGTIGTGTSINYTHTFDLTDPSVFGNVNGDSSMGTYTMADLIGQSGMQLSLRELIVHGQNAPAVGAGTAGEVDGTAGFKLVLPTLGGEIKPMGAVPEPASWALMISGFGLVGGAMRRRGRVALTA